MHIRVLGAVEVVRDTGDVALGGPKQRATLALLAADVGHVVSDDALIDGLWGDEPTPGARSTLQTYISNLRHELGDVVLREGGGYRLDVDPTDVDAVEFEAEVARAAELVETEPAEASQRLRAALALWRGRPYSGTAGSFRLELEAGRLEELRLGAVEARIEAELALGHHAELVSELEVLCAEFPLREGLRRQHMLALYRSGRQAEALRAFQKTRVYLAEELGLEPSAQLRELERSILNQDPSLILDVEPQIQTVAFLLADIEDSTVLWEMQTAAMRAALARHDEIVRRALEDTGGRIVKRVGDGVDVAFADVGAAVAAAEQIQRGLGALDSADTGPLRVRMAIDVGEVEARDGDYFGPVLNRAGRMLAAGHGGQVLLSADAHAALSATKSGWQAKALGEVRFKGIGTPQNVFQLMFDGEPSDFPPLRIDRLPPSLPGSFGHTVRGYELRERIGSGDFGVVYRAYQPSVGREVAIKVIRPELVNQPAFVRGFEAEARLVAQLEHPHIVSLYDYWRDPEGAYLVMRWLRGGSLRQALERGPWNVQSSARLLSQVGSALSYAHRQGIVHGDVKPANVLLDDEGHAYLSDFGIASRLADPSEPKRVVTSSPAYVPPEELEGGPQTPRTDLYCLGLLTFELLTGTRPPMDGALPPVIDVRPEIPAAIDAVIAKATALEPDVRYESVDAFLAAFEDALGEVTAPIGLTPAENPFKGLRAFGESDAEDFHGRDSLVVELVTAVRERRLVAVVGPSGIGKSSVVKAGLVPALRSGALPDSASWVFSDMFPGSFPYEELAAALLRIAVERPDDLVEELARDELGITRMTKRILPAEAELVLVIDQFEELFTLTTDEETRRRFLDGLSQLALDGRSRVRVVVTMRADFLDHPLRYPEFGELLRAGMVAVTVPSADELAEAIEKPAERVGVRFEPGLVSQIVAEVQEQPGALPLLQYALTELFAGRTSDVLTLEGYQATGGVVGALGRRAEELYESLDRDSQDAARQIFLRLVSVDPQAQDTRRRVRRRELRHLELEPGTLEEILRRYGKHRLLTFDREPLTRSPTVEVAHEALLGQWERLRDWIDERREDLLLRRRLVEAVDEWEDSGRRPDYLPREGRLVQFESWAATSDLALTAGEREYLSDARAAADETARRTARRRRAILVGVAAVAVVTSLLAAFALVQRSDARASALQADARRLGAQAVIGDELDQSLLLAREAYAMDDSADTRSTLLATLLKAPAAIRVLPGTGDRVQRIRGSADHGTFVTSDNVEGIAVYDARSLTLRRIVRLSEQPWVALHPDGRSLVASIFQDGYKFAFVDLRTGSVRERPRGPIWGNFVHDATVFAPDGRSLVALEARGEPPVPTLVRYSPDGRQQGRVRRLSGTFNENIALRFSPDGRRLFVNAEDEQLFVLDGSSFAVLAKREPAGLSFDVSPDGKTIAQGHKDGTVAFVDVLSGEVHDADGRHVAAVTGVGFSPDGKTLVTTGDDHNVMVWDVPTRSLREVLRGHSGRVFGPVFSADGRTVFTVGLDSSVIAWDLTGRRRLGSGFTYASAPPGNVPNDNPTALSPNGKLLAYAAPTGEVQLVELRSGRALWHSTPWSDRRLEILDKQSPLGPDVQDGTVIALAFAPDGRSLAVSGANQEIVLFESASGRVLRRIRAGEYGWVNGISFAPDGTLVAASDDGRVTRWAEDGGRTRAIRLFKRVEKFDDLKSWPARAIVSPDGSKLAITTAALRPTPSRIIVFDANTGQRLWQQLADRWFAHPAWSPDSRIVATAAKSSGELTLWDAATGERQGEPVKASAGWIDTVGFVRNGSLVVTAGTDGTLRLWDRASLKQVGSNIVGNENQNAQAFVLPDDESVLVIDITGRAWIWRLDPAVWARQACLVANRDLTRSEWKAFLPGRAYERSCSR